MTLKLLNPLSSTSLNYLARTSLAPSFEVFSVKIILSEWGMEYTILRSGKFSKRTFALCCYDGVHLSDDLNNRYRLLASRCFFVCILLDYVCKGNNSVLLLFFSIKSMFPLNLYDSPFICVSSLCDWYFGPIRSTPRCRSLTIFNEVNSRLA
jgi:hypothetical protein